MILSPSCRPDVSNSALFPAWLVVDSLKLENSEDKVNTGEEAQAAGYPYSYHRQCLVLAADHAKAISGVTLHNFVSHYAPEYTSINSPCG